MRENVGKQQYKTLKDFIKLLNHFNNFEVDEAGVNETANAVGMTPSKVSRMLNSLTEEGFFEKNLSSGKYRLGISFFQIGLVYIFNSPLRKIFRPHVEVMAKDTNMIASWAMLHKSNVIVIDRIQNLNIDLITSRFGMNLPLHTTSLGKVLLAYLSEEKQNDILESYDFNPTTIHNVPASMQPVSVFDERDTPDGSSSVSMRQGQ